MTEFKPYPYQQAGIDWIIGKKACGLFWGMGTGKTVTTLTAIDQLVYDRFEVRRVLVIAPKRVAEGTWSKEADKWSHLRLRVQPVAGTAKQREAALQAPADVWVICRDLVVWLVQYLRARGRGWPFDMVVIDELSSFKNAQAKRFRALRTVRGQIRRIVGLTGTPAPNGLIDLWPQVYLLDQGQRLGKAIGRYRARYFTPGRSNGYIVYEYLPRDGAAEEIQNALGDLCMSLKKEEVLQLPGQVFETVEVDLGQKLLKEYKRFERDSVLDALDDNGEIVAQNAAALTGKLLQYAQGAIYDEDRNVHRVHDLKLDALEELIEAANGEPVLVFYNFQHDRDRIHERIDCRDLKTQKDIDDWNAGRISVAIAHPASVGHGLNLQDGGHIIIWFGLTWSLELYQQANERLNRPGQKNVCRVYHIVAKGTHDARVLQVLEAKDTTQRALIDALRLEVLKNEKKH